ncbi:MAG: PEP-CTERM sorting domain-containing protein [Verrucomicrobiaceae bacterium]
MAKAFQASLTLGLCILLSVEASAQATSEYHFTSADFSGLGADGGNVIATYTLDSGDVDPGPGATITLTHIFSDWSDANFYYDGGNMSNSSGQYELGYSGGAYYPVSTITSAVVAEAPPSTGLDGDWQLVYDNVFRPQTNITHGGNGAVSIISDSINGSHTTSRTITYTGTDLNEDGTTNRLTSLGLGINFVNPSNTVIQYQSATVPEPSVSLLVLGGLLSVLGRRKRG